MFFISPELNWELSFAQHFWNEVFQYNLKRIVGLFNSVKRIDIDKFIRYGFFLFVCFLGKEQVLKYTFSHGLEIWSLVNIRFEKNILLEYSISYSDLTRWIKCLLQHAYVSTTHCHRGQRKEVLFNINETTFFRRRH